MLDPAVATLDLRQSTIFSRLRGLLEVTRLVRTGDELPELLASIARTVSDSLAFRTVVVNLYRREWDDFVVSDGLRQRRGTRGAARPGAQVEDWEPLLDQRFLQRGAYVVPSGEFDWDEYAGSAYTPDLAGQRRPERVASRRRALRADARQPTAGCSGSSPSTSRSRAASRAATRSTCSSRSRSTRRSPCEAAQETARAKANREALERLLDGVDAG